MKYFNVFIPFGCYGQPYHIIHQIKAFNHYEASLQAIKLYGPDAFVSGQSS